MSLILHGAHAGLVVGGLAVILWLLRASQAQDRGTQGLRAAAANGTLVEDAERRASHGLARDPARSRWLVVASLATLLAAGVHTLVDPEHFREGVRFGIFFFVLSSAQLAAAVQLLRRPTRWLAESVVALSVAVLALWVITRTVGLPFGLSKVEAVGALDSVACVGELVGILGCVCWLRGLAPIPVRAGSSMRFTAAEQR